MFALFDLFGAVVERGIAARSACVTRDARASESDESGEKLILVCDTRPFAPGGVSGRSAHLRSAHLTSRRGSGCTSPVCFYMEILERNSAIITWHVLYAHVMILVGGTHLRGSADKRALSI